MKIKVTEHYLVVQSNERKCFNLKGQTGEVVNSGIFRKGVTARFDDGEFMIPHNAYEKIRKTESM